jgi:hypothetical protein
MSPSHAGNSYAIRSAFNRPFLNKSRKKVLFWVVTLCELELFSPEDGDNMSSETLVPTYKFPQKIAMDIFTAVKNSNLKSRK